MKMVLKLNNVQLNINEKNILMNFINFLVNVILNNHIIIMIQTIQRHHLSEYHLNHCNEVDKYMKNLFLKWD